MGTLNSSENLCAEPKCQQRPRYHRAETPQKAPGWSGHISQHLHTLRTRQICSYPKHVGLSIFSDPEGTADAYQVCNTPETTQWAGSMVNCYLLSPTATHECTGLSPAYDTCSSMQVSGCWLATEKMCPQRGSCPRWFKFPRAVRDSVTEVW